MVPSIVLALRIAHALGVTVETIFSLQQEGV
jgi:DNA-binding XRE family transcriptional regulator